MTIYEARLQAVRRLIRTRFGGNQNMFCDALGLSPSYLSRMLKEEGEKGRKRIGDDMAVRIETALDLSPGSLVNPTEQLNATRTRDQMREAAAEHRLRSESELVPFFRAPSSIDEPSHRQNGIQRDVGKVTLAVMDVRASMGQGAIQPSHENVVMSMVVEEAWLRRHASFSSPDKLALVTGIGDSMYPTFEDGDPLLVDRGVTDIKLDAVYVLSLNDELYIKRVQRRPDGTVVMISDNKSYEPYHIKNGEREKFQVLGRVVMVWNAKRI